MASHTEADQRPPTENEAFAEEVKVSTHEKPFDSTEASSKVELPAGSCAVTVKVGDDSGPGQKVWFTAPNGQQMHTIVPADKKPGDEFQVLVPAPPPHKAKIVVPEGVQAGQKVIFRGPFGFDMEAVVPEGKNPGDIFYVGLAPPQPQAPSYTLTVPPDAAPGSEVYFHTADGHPMKAVVPEGKVPGEQFQVVLGPSQVTVIVPEGKSAGEEIDVAGYGGLRIKASIPIGKKPGDQFVVSLTPMSHSAKGLAALCAAAGTGNLEALKKLKDAPEFDVNGIFENGFTPLFYAATNGYTEVTQWLIEEKADVNACNESNRTPLSWAARNGHVKVVEALLAAKAELDVEDGTGRTPLALAQGYNHPDVVTVLLAAGAKDSKAAAAEEQPKASEPAEPKQVDKLDKKPVRKKK